MSAAKVLADRYWWRTWGDQFGWRLYAFTDRSVADFFICRDFPNQRVVITNEMRSAIDARLRSELAAIRQAFPEDHPARTEGSIANGVRGLATELHSLKYEADGQLRANLSNDAIGSMLTTTTKLRALLNKCHGALETVERTTGYSLAGLLAEITAALGSPQKP